MSLCKCTKMEKMDGFTRYIKQIRDTLAKVESLKHLHVVMGNESCDLDSLTSSLALAYYLHVSITSCHVIPILNIPRRDFPLRTEHRFVLKVWNIEEADLIFRDEIDLRQMQQNLNLRVSLVDHHMLRPEESFLTHSIVQIFDHRPIDPHFTAHIVAVIEQVGSCATLIAKEIFDNNEALWCDSLASILYDTIVFDTIHLSPEAGRVKDLDNLIVTKLRDRYQWLKDPKPLFDELWSAHNDTSQLTPYQILFKDLKLVENVPVPGVPSLVKEFLQLPSAVDDLEKFCTHHNTALTVIIGLSAENGQVERDLAIFGSIDSTLSKEILNNLTNALTLKGYDFNWQQHPTEKADMVYLKQGNVKLTRKHILPLIKDAVNK